MKFNRLRHNLTPIFDLIRASLDEKQKQNTSHYITTIDHHTVFQAIYFPGYRRAA